MRRFTGACVVACAGTTAASAIGGCDLDLPAYTPDAGAQQFIDANFGTDVAQPVEDAKVEEDTSVVDAGVDADASGPRKRVFVTSATSNGAFGATGLAALTAADARCQTAADGQNLKGTFVAWLSFANPAAPAITRIAKDVGPWVLLGTNTVVFANKTAMTTTGPEVPIDRDETGKAVGAPDTVWTGTAANGTAEGNPCST